MQTAQSATIDRQSMPYATSHATFSSRLGKAIQCRQGVVTYPRRDYYRFPALGPKWISEFATLAWLAACRTGLANNSPDFPKLSNSLNTILARLDDYSAAHDGFADDESRELFVELLAYRILGPWFVRLSIDTPEFWKLYDSVNRQYRVRKNVSRYWIGGTFTLIACPAQDRRVLRVPTCNELSVFRTFLLQQYSISRQGIRSQTSSRRYRFLIAARAFENTTLWLADRVGPRGRVIAFECQAANRQLAEENVSLNPAVERAHHHRPAGVVARIAIRPGGSPNSWGPGSTVLDLATEFVKGRHRISSSDA